MSPAASLLAIPRRWGLDGAVNAQPSWSEPCCCWLPCQSMNTCICTVQYTKIHYRVVSVRHYESKLHLGLGLSYMVLMTVSLALCIALQFKLAFSHASQPHLLKCLLCYHFQLLVSQINVASHSSDISSLVKQKNSSHFFCSLSCAFEFTFLTKLKVITSDFQFAEGLLQFRCPRS